MFVNRIANQVFNNFFVHDLDDQTLKGRVVWQIANDLGEEYEWDKPPDLYVLYDFAKCLQALESAHKALDDPKHRRELADLIEYVLQSSEVDLGVTWRNGVFLKKGAGLLDNALVNQNLEWLSEPRYSNVFKPFEKGLNHYLRMQKDPKLASEEYRVLLKAYITFANNFRHGLEPGKKKPNLSPNEVESFVYLTGWFTRLAIAK